MTRNTPLNPIIHGIFSYQLKNVAKKIIGLGVVRPSHLPIFEVHQKIPLYTHIQPADYYPTIFLLRIQFEGARPQRDLKIFPGRR